MSYGLVSARVGHAPFPSAGFHTLPIGAGGQLTGIDIHADGTKVIRADTYGAYLWNPTAVSPGNAGGFGKWVNLINSSSIPSPTVGSPYNLPWGVYEIRTAPSNSSHLYMIAGGAIYYSTNRGTSWTQGTNYTNAPGFIDPNLNTKFFGPYLAVDPNNELIALAGTPSNGVWKTTDGGATWTQVSTAQLPASTTGPDGKGGHNIAYVTSSSVFATVYGTGIYHSADGGSTWTLLNTGTGTMPTSLAHTFVGQDGKFYGGGDGTTNISVYDLASNAWNVYSTGLHLVRTVAMNPTNSSHIIAFSDDGTFSSSTTGASGTWSGYNDLPNVVRSATDVPWLAELYGNSMSIAACAFDPTGTTLYVAAGVGVWKTTDTINTSGSTFVQRWVSQSVGIEQMVADWAVSPPGGSTIMAFFDRPIFTITSKTRFPSSYGPSYPGVSGGLQVFEGYSCDYASANPATIVALCNNPFGSGNVIGVSNNGGGTDGGPSNWTLNTTHLPPGNAGGCIAAASATHFLVATQQGGLFYTTDAAATAWQSPTINGGAILNTDAGWSTFSASHKIENICADRVLPNTFFAQNMGATAPGIYISTDGGATWTKVFTGLVDPSYDGVDQQMRSVPGQSGNFFYSSGATDLSLTPSFHEFNWNGTTLTHTVVPNVTTVWAFGYGAAKPGNTYPSIYIYGKVSGVMGVWRSDDHCATWTQLGTGAFPNGSLDEVAFCIGDMGTYGLCYVGFNGSGVLYWTP